MANFQRVLILQGGGSLGAYEAGVYQALYEMVTKSDKERGFKNKPIVDIVAGTPIGAINSNEYIHLNRASVEYLLQISSLVWIP
jgi:predicted acylesterase/phospholipase RssA